MLLWIDLCMQGNVCVPFSFYLLLAVTSWAKNYVMEYLNGKYKLWSTGCHVYCVIICQTCMFVYDVKISSLEVQQSVKRILLYKIFSCIIHLRMLYCAILHVFNYIFLVTMCSLHIVNCENDRACWFRMEVLHQHDRKPSLCLLDFFCCLLLSVTTVLYSESSCAGLPCGGLSLTDLRMSCIAQHGGSTVQ